MLCDMMKGLKLVRILHSDWQCSAKHAKCSCTLSDVRSLTACGQWSQGMVIHHGPTMPQM